MRRSNPMWLDAIIHMNRMAWPMFGGYAAFGAAIAWAWPVLWWWGVGVSAAGAFLLVYAWWLQYKLVRNYRPIAEHFAALHPEIMERRRG